MKYFFYLSAAAGLLCCLAASPARADLATAEAGAGVTSSGQLSDALLDAASTVSESSTLASETKSTGPASAPATSMGVDSSNGPTPTGAMAAASVGSAGLFATGVTSGTGDSSQVAPPAGLVQGEGNHYVGSLSVPTTDLSSMSASLGTPLIAPNDVAVTPTPIPATILLLGGGLLGIFSLRRSARLPLGTAPFAKGGSSCQAVH